MDQKWIRSGQNCLIRSANLSFPWSDMIYQAVDKRIMNGNGVDGPTESDSCRPDEWIYLHTRYIVEIRETAEHATREFCQTLLGLMMWVFICGWTILS